MNMNGLDTKVADIQLHHVALKYCKTIIITKKQNINRRRQSQETYGVEENLFFDVSSYTQPQNDLSMITNGLSLHPSTDVMVTALFPYYE